MQVGGSQVEPMPIAEAFEAAGVVATPFSSGPPSAEAMQAALARFHTAIAAVTVPLPGNLLPGEGASAISQLASQYNFDVDGTEHTITASECARYLVNWPARRQDTGEVALSVALQKKYPMVAVVCEAYKRLHAAA